MKSTSIVHAAFGNITEDEQGWEGKTTTIENMWVCEKVKLYDAVVDQGQRDYIIYMVGNWFIAQQKVRCSETHEFLTIQAVLRSSGAIEDLCFLLYLAFEYWENNIVPSVCLADVFIK